MAAIQVQREPFNKINELIRNELETKKQNERFTGDTVFTVSKQHVAAQI